MSESRHVSAGSVTFGNDMPLVLIAGPCAMESHDHAMDMAGKLKEICAKLELGLVFKPRLTRPTGPAPTARAALVSTKR